MRNYATALANNREYVKSNDLLRRVKRLMPAVGNHVMLQITFAENFLNLHQLDSARYYWNQAWANEQNHGGDKAEGFSVRSALVQLKNRSGLYFRYTFGYYHLRQVCRLRQS